ANAAGEPRASRKETTAIQRAVGQPEPSVKIEISSAFDEIVKQEKAAEAKAAANPLAGAGPAGVAGTAGKPVSAEDIYSTASDGGKTAALGGIGLGGNSGIAGAGKASAPSPTEAARQVDTGKMPGPDQPSDATDSPSKDWTEKVKAAEEKPPEPPAEPISKKLLDFLQNLWRAGGQAIDVVDGANKALNPAKAANAADGPLTYADPSVKKSNSV
ncbi:MAG: hypothetical protein JWQ88_625, partial [Rhodoferax sp.]|nr:hypothetical protein [Rhodoferax sp.]